MSTSPMRTLVLLLVGAAVVAWGYSVPGGYLVWIGLGWLVVLAGVITWVFALVNAARSKDVRPSVALPGVVVLVLAVVLAFNVSMRVAYALSRAEMDALVVASATAGTAGQIEPRRVGLYETVFIDAYPGGVRFLIAGTGLFDPAGFAFFGAGSPPYEPGHQYVPFEGDWRIWVSSW